MRLSGQDVVQLVLVHHRVRAGGRAGAREEVEDVTQPRDAAVEEIFALSRPIEPTADRDFAPRHRQGPVVRERQLDLSEADRLARC